MCVLFLRDRSRFRRSQETTHQKSIPRNIMAREKWYPVSQCSHRDSRHCCIQQFTGRRTFPPGHLPSKTTTVPTVPGHIPFPPTFWRIWGIPPCHWSSQGRRQTSATRLHKSDYWTMNRTYFHCLSSMGYRASAESWLGELALDHPHFLAVD